MKKKVNTDPPLAKRRAVLSAS